MSKNRQFNYLGIRRASGCTKNPEGGGAIRSTQKFLCSQAREHEGLRLDQADEVSEGPCCNVLEYMKVHVGTDSRNGISMKVLPMNLRSYLKAQVLRGCTCLVLHTCRKYGWIWLWVC